jgi:hypothetical protein
VLIQRWLRSSNQYSTAITATLFQLCARNGALLRVMPQSQRCSDQGHPTRAPGCSSVEPHRSAVRSACGFDRVSVREYPRKVGDLLAQRRYQLGFKQDNRVIALASLLCRTFLNQLSILTAVASPRRASPSSGQVAKCRAVVSWRGVSTTAICPKQKNTSN